ncbi:unnamed protein product [Albugo candida]|nr:unnamed protein product [Albugo candida]|eukprot:CCI47556.1 unnamed protein product [Albugo candida]
MDEEKQSDVNSNSLDPLSYEGNERMHETIVPITTNDQSERSLVNASYQVETEENVLCVEFNTSVKQIFKTFDSTKFGKLCRACPKLMNANLTRAIVDIIFIKAVRKTEQRMNYDSFLDALRMVAIKKYHRMPIHRSLPRLIVSHLSRLPRLYYLKKDEKLQVVFFVE